MLIRLRSIPSRVNQRTEGEGADVETDESPDTSASPFVIPEVPAVSDDSAATGDEVSGNRSEDSSADSSAADSEPTETGERRRAGVQCI